MIEDISGMYASKIKKLWYKNLILYQIYPRSFKDSNGDGIGDILGIVEKLDYLAGNENSLGINAIWLSPIYDSPMADFGYDISDYYSIHPVFGTMSDFDVLIRAAHLKNIKVFMDFIPTHTSDQNKWFLESKSSVNSTKRDWYIWADQTSDGSLPNNWQSVFGGSAWELDKNTGQYYLHTFLKEQPDLNWRNPEVVSEMLNVLRFWIEKGVDGFRTDSLPHVFKDPNLRDEPINHDYQEGQWSWMKLKHIHTTNLPEMADLFKYFNELFDSFPDRQLYMVTEDFFAGPKELRWYYEHINTDKFAPLNLSLPRIEWSAEKVKNFVDEYEQALGDDYWPNYCLGNHDNPRLSKRYGTQNVRTAAMLLLSLRGLPVLYYGDEIGMQNVEIPEDQVQDPFEIKDPGKGAGRDPERTPMQWDNSVNSGFSIGKPWLPIAEDYKERNVMRQISDQTSILELYKRLIRLRLEHNSLLQGKYIPSALSNRNIFAYYRRSDDEIILVLLNFTDKNETVVLENNVKVLIDTKLKEVGKIISQGNFEVQANTGYILSIQ